MAKLFLIAGCFQGFLSVAFGAFGAHALKTRFDEYAMGVYKTGVEYQFSHTFALLAVGLLLLKVDEKLLQYSGWSFLLGTIVFSGSLYLLAFTGVKTWGAVTPIGGTLFLAGWLMAAFAVSKANF